MNVGKGALSVMRRVQYRRVVTKFLLALLTACNGASVTADSQSAAAPVPPAADVSYIRGTGGHVMPLERGATPSTKSAAFGTSALLRYYRGRVVSNVDVVQVLYGSGTYESYVSGTSTPNVATFFAGLTNSGYIDWLTEYNTNAPTVGLPQTIGRGTFNRRVQIAPATVNNGALITNQSIQDELNAKITSGALPPATANTVYMVNFPKGKVIDLNGSTSCSAFCAFHGTFVRGSTSIGYGVMPDMSVGSGCETACGGGTPFDNQTYVTSHELIETLTDVEVGLAATVGPPLAWYDSINGEIGDICGAQRGTIVGADGVSYAVQKEWSNREFACIVTRPLTGNQFSVGLASTAAKVVAGSAISVSVNTTLVSGGAQTVTLSVSGLPAGVTGAFVPPSLAAGSSSNLTLTSSASAVPETTQFVVSGNTGFEVHTAAGQLTVTAAASAIVNGGFESGTLTGWVRSGTTAAVKSPHTGIFSAKVGGIAAGGESRLSQAFNAPVGSATFGFWYQGRCTGAISTNSVQIKLSDLTALTDDNLVGDTCRNDGTWVNVTAALVGGHRYELRVSNSNSASTTPSFTLLDDVTVQ